MEKDSSQLQLRKRDMKARHGSAGNETIREGNQSRRDGKIRNYSSGSGCKLKSFSPAAFFSAYFFIQASQLFPAAVSRPVKARAAISEYGIPTFWLESFGYRRTSESFSVAPLRRSNR